MLHYYLFATCAALSKASKTGKHLRRDAGNRKHSYIDPEPTLMHGARKEQHGDQDFLVTLQPSFIC